MGPQMNARQQRHVGALGNTLGEAQVRGSPRTHPGITAAHLGLPLRHPTGVSVAALCSPARTGRATSHHPPLSSAPPFLWNGVEMRRHGSGSPTRRAIGCGWAGRILRAAVIPSPETLLHLSVAVMLRVWTLTRFREDLNWRAFTLMD